MAKAAAPLIGDHVSEEQCKKAVDALIGHAQKLSKEKEDTELIAGKDETMWLGVTIKEIQTLKHSGRKSRRITIPHSIIDPRTTPVCLITKDPQREYKDLLDQHGIKFINRVVGVEKLKGKFKPYEARRQLLRENGLFLADERVYNILPSLIGKTVIQAKRDPIPVCLTRKDLKKELETAISSTYVNQNRGVATAVKVGHVDMSPEKILANIKAAIPEIVKHKGGWENMQSLNLKTDRSISLPVWSCALGSTDGGRWDLPSAKAKSKETEEEADQWGGIEDEEFTGFGDEAVPQTEKSVPLKKQISSSTLEADDEREGGLDLDLSSSSDEETVKVAPKKRKNQVSEKKKSKKAKLDQKTVEESGASDDTETAQTPKVEPEKKKSKKAKGTKSKEPVPLDEPTESPKKSTPAPAKASKAKVDSTATSNGKAPAPAPKSKKDRAAKPPVAEPSSDDTPKETAKAAASRDDAKRKRAANGADKKKAKVTGGPTKKLAKEKIVGKAASARL